MNIQPATRLRAYFCFLALLCGCADITHARGDDTPRLDLAGNWSFQLDQDDIGIQEQWFNRGYRESVRLPGSIQSQGIGERPTLETVWTGSIRPEVIQMPRYAPYRSPDNFKMPFWLQPDRHYVGPAWFQRNVTIPAAWAGKRLILYLERCHWFTRVWVDDHEAGAGESLSTPHVFDLTEFLSPGDHRLTIRIDNRVRIKVGENSHSVTDHTQTNWNGIVGRLELHAVPPVWLDDVQVFPDVQRQMARVLVTVKNQTGQPVKPTLSLNATIDNQVSETVTSSIVVDNASAEKTLEVPLGPQAKLWDEHEPNLYTLTVRLTGASTDTKQVTFGLRELATQGTRFTLNGHPIYFRGTLECCIFPLTGYPPTDVASWKHLIGRCREFGLNHMRFHSWCPPEAAFTAADELGFYFQVECASWANGDASVGNGTALDDWLYREADRMVKTYGNHPSFVLLAYGNEPAGPGPHRQGEDYLAAWVNHYKQAAPRQLITCASGWPYLPESQFHVMHAPLRQHHVFNRERPETTKDYSQQVARYSVPLISHETGQWCVFPDLDEMARYTGVLRPKNFEIVQDFLRSHGLLGQAREFLMASGRFQALLYKEEIEVMLRTAGFGGFQLLDLHDFPGQGTALIGVVDPFWNPKPYVTGAGFRRFCGAVVPLARLPRRTWTSDQIFSADVDVSQFGRDDLTGVTVTWSLAGDRDQEIGSGTWADVDLRRGGLRKVGRVVCPLGSVSRASRLKLTVTISGTPYANDWDVWVYPPTVDTSPGSDVLIARSIDQQVETRLADGGKVLLLPPPGTVAGETHGSFEPIFWNRLWFPTQEVHTLGLLCRDDHPALAEFPTGSHCDWQWWDLCNRSQPVVMDTLPSGLSPIVQVIDDWNTCRKLGLVLEARVGGGKLLLCAIDLERELEQRPVARQLRHSLLRYMASAQFEPAVDVRLDGIRELLRPPTWLQERAAVARASSQQTGYEAEKAIDGNPHTIWHTTWGEQGAQFPHEFILDLRQPAEIAGLTCLPRQDMANGRISRFAVYVSNDGRDWGGVVATGDWPDSARLQTVRFARPVTARFVKLVALSEVHGNPFASAAEIDLLLPK